MLFSLSWRNLNYLPLSQKEHPWLWVGSEVLVNLCHFLNILLLRISWNLLLFSKVVSPQRRWFDFYFSRTRTRSGPSRTPPWLFQRVSGRAFWKRAAKSFPRRLRRLNFLNNSAAAWSKANKRNKTSEVMRHKYEQTASQSIPDGEPRRFGATHEDNAFDWTWPPPPPSPICGLSKKKPNYIQDYKASIWGILSVRHKTITGIHSAAANCSKILHSLSVNY